MEVEQITHEAFIYDLLRVRENSVLPDPIYFLHSTILFVPSKIMTKKSPPEKLSNKLNSLGRIFSARQFDPDFQRIRRSARTEIALVDDRASM